MGSGQNILFADLQDLSAQHQSESCQATQHQDRNIAKEKSALQKETEA